MQDQADSLARRVPWNKGKVTGATLGGAPLMGPRRNAAFQCHQRPVSRWWIIMLTARIRPQVITPPTIP
jgi:hypothetical protein